MKTTSKLRQPQNKDNLKNEDNLENEDNINNEDELQIKMTCQCIKMTSK